MCYNEPMKVKLITVGKLKEKYLKDGIAEYIKRLGRFTKFESIELTDEKTPDNASEAENKAILDKEGPVSYTHLHKALVLLSRGRVP